MKPVSLDYLFNWCICLDLYRAVFLFTEYAIGTSSSRSTIFCNYIISCFGGILTNLIFRFLQLPSDSISAEFIDSSFIIGPLCLSDWYLLGELSSVSPELSFCIFSLSSFRISPYAKVLNFLRRDVAEGVVASVDSSSLVPEKGILWAILGAIVCSFLNSFYLLEQSMD